MPNIPKVSVIIPVYNVENYLEDCLDTIINQTLKDIEIICVNDGSTDKSSDILKKFAAKDNRITIINQENIGAGAARNKGLKIAEGEYLSFLDADDFFELDMLEKAYDYSSKKLLDITVYGVKTFNDKTSEIKYHNLSFQRKYLPKKVIFNYKDFSKYIFNTFQNWTWNKLFKRSFILENHIEFQELFRTNDLLFTCKALIKAKKISVLDVPLVYYRIKHDFHSQNTNHEHPFDFYYAMIALKNFLIDEKIFEDVEQSFVNWATSGCLYNLRSLNTNESYEKLYNFLHDEGIKQLSISRRPDEYFYNTGFLEIKKVERYPLLKPSDKPRVSIIIPTFNVEMYLKECLDSVVNQTLRDIEIICVNDGSTDNSLSILEEYAKKDQRIKIISKHNSGYGHTMNVGIEAATGEYVGIVEPDDYVKLDMYETLYLEAVKNDVDLIKADFYLFTGTGENIKKTYMKVAREDSNYNFVINPQEDLRVFRFILHTWTGIYKRNFLEKYNIRHNETPGASFQDNGFWFQTLAFSKRTYFLNKPLYMNRRDNPASSVHDKGKVFAACKEHDFVRDILNNSSELNENPEFKEKLIYVCQYKRFDSYMFTIHRVGSEFYKMFLEKFHEDYVLAAENNELDEELFSKEEWELLQRIIKDPKSVKESDFKNVPRKSSAGYLIYKKRKFNRLLSFLYILKKEKLNPKNIYKIYKARRQIKSLNLFDEVYYLTHCVDVRKSNMNPLDHYIYSGWKEKRSPSKKFDGNYYLRKYSDVKKFKTNPLVHYVLHGKKEGRFPNRHAEINSPQNIIKNFQGKIKNLERSLSQSNNYLQNIKTEIEENNQLHKKEIKNFEKKLNLLTSVLYDIIEGSNKKKLCPICGTEILAFLPFGEKARPGAKCPNCGSLERHRATYIFLKEKTNVFEESIGLLHIAPEKIFYDIFGKQENINYLTADLNDKPSHVMEKMDIQDIQYSDNTFDFIYCSHVLEHVPDDRKAIDELYRVLKPDGKALILVPMDRSLDKTLEDPSYNTPELRLKYYLQSDHLRLYGLDFTDRLEDAGFNVLSDNIKFREDMDEEELKRYGIDKCIQFFYCVKHD